jgi:formylglycine-generating enzyme required for sulfatase activity
MKKTLQTQRVLLALALLVAVGSVACGLRESSLKNGKQQPATGEGTQAAKPGGIAKPSEVPKPGEVDTVDLGGGVKMELVWVPAGSFQMGSPDSEVGHQSSEGPVHTVELDGFWMGKYEVTQEQYEVVMGRNLSTFKGAKNPVEQITWNDATEFCRKLGGGASSPPLRGQDGPTPRVFRLPTEAEWEYACRAGSTTRFCFGDFDNDLGDYAWYGGNSGNQTHPVGKKKPNAWALYDMHGNVWEWCGDWYGRRYYAESDGKNPLGPSSGEYRVLRGGMWILGPDDCRSACRVGLSPSVANIYRGFRVVCSGSSFR